MKRIVRSAIEWEKTRILFIKCVFIVWFKWLFIRYVFTKTALEMLFSASFKLHKKKTLQSAKLMKLLWLLQI